MWCQTHGGLLNHCDECVAELRAQLERVGFSLREATDALVTERNNSVYRSNVQVYNKQKEQEISDLRAELEKVKRLQIDSDDRHLTSMEKLIDAGTEITDLRAEVGQLQQLNEKQTEHLTEQVIKRNSLRADLQKCVEIRFAEKDRKNKEISDLNARVAALEEENVELKQFLWREGIDPSEALEAAKEK